MKRTNRRNRRRPSKAPGVSGEDPHLQRERERYAEPIASREWLLSHIESSAQALSAARLAKRLGLTTDTQRTALEKRLAAMVRDGELSAEEGGFRAMGAGHLITGRVRGRAQGEVLLLPDDGSAPLVIARGDLASLMHRDRVEARIVGIGEKGRRLAKVVRRVDEGPARIAGMLMGGRGTARLEAEDPGHWYPIELDADHLHGAANGDYIVAQVHRRPLRDTPAKARVVEVLSDMRPADRAAVFAILRHDLPVEFPRDVLASAEALGTEVGARDLKNRIDLRDLPLVTIDGEDARDFDDAVFAQPSRGEGWRLIVAIADVSHYVRPHSALDAEARRRSTSVYFPDRAIPMLPERLSNHLCSLMPNVDRLAMVCDMHVAKNGGVSRARFYEAVIRSHARLTYDNAWAYLAAPAAANVSVPAEVRGSLDSLHEVYGALARARAGRGALDFRGSEVKARIGSDGVIVGFAASERNDAHRLIEECMIAANVQSAAALRKHKMPGLYRIHAPPKSDRVSELQRVMQALQVGAQFSQDPTPREFRQLIERLQGRADSQLLEMLVIRTLAQAVYSPGNVGHFGLALQEYAHFTSPIRRYPDLIVHRSLKAALLPESVEGRRYETTDLDELGVETSLRERRADDAARDVISYLKCLYMQPRIGEVFDASITSATEFGLFVQLSQVPIDGLVHISTLPGDFWELDRSRVQLVGRRTHKRWVLGGAVRVRLARVDLAQRRIDFELDDAALPRAHALRRRSRSRARA